MKQYIANIQEDHTLQSKLQLCQTVLHRQRAHTHRKAALLALHASDRASCEVLVFHFNSGPREEAAFERAGDDAPRIDSPLMLVGLGSCADYRAAVRTVNELRAEGELSQTLPSPSCKDLADAEGLHACPAWRDLHCQPPRLRGCAHHDGLLDAVLREDLTAAVERSGSAMEATAYPPHHLVRYIQPSTHCSSNPCSKIAELTWTQASRFWKRGRDPTMCLCCSLLPVTRPSSHCPPPRMAPGGRCVTLFINMEN